MDRRREPRVAIDQIATLTVLGESPQTMAVHIADGHGNGLRVELPVALAVDQPVKIEYGEVLVLAEVCYCGPGRAGGGFPFTAGMVIREFLNGLGDLHRLMLALDNEAGRVEEKVR
jgi:hypothetical protein